MTLCSFEKAFHVFFVSDAFWLSVLLSRLLDKLLKKLMVSLAGAIQTLKVLISDNFALNAQPNLSLELDHLYYPISEQHQQL